MVVHVNSALFGRNDANTCINSGSGSTNTNCLIDVTKSLQSTCDNLNFCILSSNFDKFGNSVSHEYQNIYK